MVRSVNELTGAGNAVDGIRDRVGHVEASPTGGSVVPLQLIAVEVVSKRAGNSADAADGMGACNITVVAHAGFAGDAAIVEVSEALRGLAVLRAVDCT